MFNSLSVLNQYDYKHANVLKSINNVQCSMFNVNCLSPGRYLQLNIIQLIWMKKPNERRAVQLFKHVEYIWNQQCDLLTLHMQEVRRSSTYFSSLSNIQNTLTNTKVVTLSCWPSSVIVVVLNVVLFFVDWITAGIMTLLQTGLRT